MKKDNIRDYATSAYRFYAREGNSDKYKEKLLKNIEERHSDNLGVMNGISNPTESQVLYSEKVNEEHIAEIRDLEAVERTLEMCSVPNKPAKQMKYLIEKVYFTEPNKPLKKGDIHNRVIKCSMELEIGENTAYKMLKSARKLFAINREIREGDI